VFTCLVVGEILRTRIQRIIHMQDRIYNYNNLWEIVGKENTPFSLPHLCRIFHLILHRLLSETHNNNICTTYKKIKYCTEELKKRLGVILL
jgi:hypothetical protein